MTGSTNGNRIMATTIRVKMPFSIRYGRSRRLATCSSRCFWSSAGIRISRYQRTFDLYDERRRSAGGNGESDLDLSKKSERHFRSVASLGSSILIRAGLPFVAGPFLHIDVNERVCIVDEIRERG